MLFELFDVKRSSLLSLLGIKRVIFIKNFVIYGKRSLCRNIGTGAGITTNSYVYRLTWFRLLINRFYLGRQGVGFRMNLKNEVQNTSVVGWVRNNETTDDVNDVFRRFCCGSRPTPPLVQNRIMLSLTFRTVNVQSIPQSLKETIIQYFYIRESEW